ncbi:tetratricopeptide repeat protein [Vibrio fluvialis]|uniref:tetratricopeptide repeat protein n=1 Tax=Vibrio fluvialis TaxID=676 RepID=UPI001C9D04CD|nr:tetratricopeptide repeat protein [Vibrio fluvialis]MBY8287063.1 sel1 repeat family protein [Vibrio fluvialis]MCE7644963.1 sel1 repeat family protein [Vibrio fluvialis]
MNTIGIAIGATGLSLILIFVWMISLSIRKKRLEAEKKAREEAYRKALERQRDEERKERLYKAESGHVPTMLYLAKEAERSNLREALFWYEKAAHNENITGMYGIVRICQRIRDDYILKEKAKFWQNYIRGQEGDLGAKYETGRALVHGRGVEVDVSKGIAMIQDAAEDQYIDAILFMGDWCVSKDNIAPAPGDSTYWYSKAAKLNSLEGMMKLGINYIKGIGIAADFQKGVYWLERASEKGHAEAMYHAGQAWIDRGANGNAIAYIWLFLSAFFGYEPAKSLRDQVGGRIGVDSVVGLQSLSKPLQKKISSGTVSKHSIIRALNKLYKRGIPVPKKGEAMDDDGIADNVSDTLLDELDGSVFDEASAAETPAEEKPSALNFSQTSMDKF